LQGRSDFIYGLEFEVFFVTSHGSLFIAELLFLEFSFCFLVCLFLSAILQYVVYKKKLIKKINIYIYIYIYYHLHILYLNYEKFLHGIHLNLSSREDISYSIRSKFIYHLNQVSKALIYILHSVNS